VVQQICGIVGGIGSIVFMIWLAYEYGQKDGYDAEDDLYNLRNYKE